MFSGFVPATAYRVPETVRAVSGSGFAFDAGDAADGGDGGCRTSVSRSRKRDVLGALSGSGGARGHGHERHEGRCQDDESMTPGVRRSHVA